MAETTQSQVLTRRSVMRRLLSVVPSSILPIRGATIDAPTPSAAALTLRKSEVPWECATSALPADVAERDLLHGITEALPSLDAADSAMSLIAADEGAGTLTTPYVASFVAVTDRQEFDRGRIDAAVLQWVTATYGSDLPEAFEPVSATRRTSAATRWLSALSIHSTGHQTMFSWQCVGDTLFLTRISAYEDQCSVPETTRQIDQTLRQRRRAWLQDQSDDRLVNT